MPPVPSQHGQGCLGAQSVHKSQGGQGPWIPCGSVEEMAHGHVLSLLSNTRTQLIQVSTGEVYSKNTGKCSSGHGICRMVRHQLEDGQGEW